MIIKMLDKSWVNYLYCDVVRIFMRIYILAV